MDKDEPATPKKKMNTGSKTDRELQPLGGSVGKKTQRKRVKFILEETHDNEES